MARYIATSLIEPALFPIRSIMDSATRNVNLLEE